MYESNTTNKTVLWMSSSKIRNLSHMVVICSFEILES